MAQQVEVKVPDIGDFKDVEVIEVLVKPGDAIAKEQSLVTVESDKASMEIPSSAAGIVKQLMVKLGDKVSKDSPLLVLDSDAKAAPAPTPAAPAPAAPDARSRGEGAACREHRCLRPRRPNHRLPLLIHRRARMHSPPKWELVRSRSILARRLRQSHTHRRRCAGSPVNWALSWRRCEAADPRDASPKTTCANT